MTDLLAALGADIQRIGITGFLVFVRVGAAMALLPAFGEQVIPARVRLALTAAFTAAVYPAVADGFNANPAFLSYLLTETVIGLTLGIGLRLVLMALQVAGAIAAHATSLSQIFGGVGAEPQPAIGQLLYMGCLAFAVSAGLHVRVAAAFITSYAVFPAGHLPDPSSLAEWGVARGAGVFSLAVALAMPFVIASLIYNIALGIINRAMPQLMVAMVGAPAITGGGLLLLLAVFPQIFQLWREALWSAMADPLGGTL